MCLYLRNMKTSEMLLDFPTFSVSISLDVFLQITYTALLFRLLENLGKLVFVHPKCTLKERRLRNHEYSNCLSLQSTVQKIVSLGVLVNFYWEFCNVWQGWEPCFFSVLCFMCSIWKITYSWSVGYVTYISKFEKCKWQPFFFHSKAGLCFCSFTF